MIGEDPNDIQRIWTKLVWAGASVGRSGLATQAIAAIDIALWDLKAKRAGLPLAKLLGAYRDSVACYNTSGGFLSSSIEEIIDNSHAAIERGIGGVKIKVGQPDSRIDLKRVETVRAALSDDVALMVDANQQWDRVSALRIGRQLESFQLTWIEEPLDCYDAEGHAMLAESLTPRSQLGRCSLAPPSIARSSSAARWTSSSPMLPGSAVSPSSCGLRR